MQRNVDISEITVVGGSTSNTMDTDLILARLIELRKNYQAARQPLESLWDDYYASYITTPAAAARVSSSVSKRIVGDVNTQWRHRLKTPKAFETVETIVSWMMSAFFPNEFWFDLRPQTPMYDPNFQQQLDVVKFYLSKTLSDAGVKRKFRIFLRELCIAGTAGIAFPLVGTSLKLDVMPCYSFYLDPEQQDPNEANMIRKYTVSRVQLLTLIKDEYFNVAEVKDFEDLTAAPSRGMFGHDSKVQGNLNQLMGVQAGNQSEARYYHDVYEYWGNIIVEDKMLINVRATFTGDKLLGIERNPFERKPFVIGSYIQLSKSPYGIGAIQPIASQLYYKDILTSRHADNVAISSDVMLEIVEGQVLEPEKVVVKPGQKIMVTQKGSINPISFPMSNVALSEMSLIDQTIDKATGTGPYIGVNAGRSGDRVTAAEISAQREAGGNRLTDVFADVETTVLLPLLCGYYYYLRNFAKALEAVVYSPEGNYFVIRGEAFNQDVEFITVGANNVADKEYRTRQLIDFLNLAAGNEQMAQRINWDEATQLLAKYFVPDTAQRLVQAAPAPAPDPNQQMQDPMMGALNEAAAYSGGAVGQQALQAQVASGQLEASSEQVRQQLTGIS